MKNTARDKASLKHIVETYGKEDVMKYVNHLDEAYQIGSKLPDFSGVSNPIIKKYIAEGHILDQTGIYLSRIVSYIDNRLSKRKELFEFATYARDMIKDTWTNYCHDSYFFGSFVTRFAELAECFKEYDNNSVEQYYKKALEVLGNIREQYEQGLLLLRSFNDDMKKRGIKESVNDDRNSLKRLVEAYGKEDVMKFVKRINEEINEDNDVQTYLIELSIYNGGGWQTIEEKGYYIVKTSDYPVDENKHITDEALDSLCELNDLTVPHFPGIYKKYYTNEETLREDAKTGYLTWRVVEEGPDVEKDYEIYLDAMKTVDYLRNKGISI